MLSTTNQRRTNEASRERRERKADLQRARRITLAADMRCLTRDGDLFVYREDPVWILVMRTLVCISCGAFTSHASHAPARSRERNSTPSRASAIFFTPVYFTSSSFYFPLFPCRDCKILPIPTMAFFRENPSASSRPCNASDGMSLRIVAQARERERALVSVSQSVSQSSVSFRLRNAPKRSLPRLLRLIRFDYSTPPRNLEPRDFPRARETRFLVVSSRSYIQDGGEGNVALDNGVARRTRPRDGNENPTRISARVPRL